MILDVLGIPANHPARRLARDAGEAVLQHGSGFVLWLVFRKVGR